MTSAPAASAARASATVEMLANQAILRSLALATKPGENRPITDETALGATESNVSHCAVKSGGVESPAAAGTVGPQRLRKSRTRVSWTGFRCGGGSGIQRFNWNGPLLP